jgi:two-component system copper resistance phosphate regulon response regulator CusR
MGTVQADPAAGTSVLVVDDDDAIRLLLSRALAAEGLTVDLAGNGADGLRQALGEDHDLVILDLIMPGLDGWGVLRRLLRERPRQAVLILSCLDDVRSKVECFELGARDYLTKPFAMAELIARVRNQLRGDPFDRLIRVGDLRLHAGRMEADIGRGPVPLTRLEFLVLTELMEHPGQPVSREQLLASAWGYEFEPDSNIVSVCVWRLRAKLGDQLIKTIRGEGYQLADR